MNNLTIAVIAIAVAQALTILLTIGRDREIKKLRELVTQQRLFISEIKGWLLRERIELAQPRRIKPDRRPIADEIRVSENKTPEIKIPGIKASEIVPGNNAPEIKIPEIKAPEIVPENNAPEIKMPEVKVPEQPVTLKDLLATVQTDTPEDETKEDATKRLTKATNWLKEDVDKAREIVAVLHGKPPGWIG